MSARPFCTAIVVGGGSGKRMGGTQNKIFLDLNGMPVLAHTLLVFENCPLIDVYKRQDISNRDRILLPADGIMVAVRFPVLIQITFF